MNDDAVLGEDFKKIGRRFVAKREERDADAAKAKQSEEDYRELEAEVWMALEESPLEGDIKIDLGEPYGVVTFGPRETYYARVLNKEDVLEHFEQRAMIDDVMTPSLSKARLNEVVRDCIDAGKEPPPGLDFYAKRGVNITRKK